MCLETAPRGRYLYFRLEETPLRRASHAEIQVAVHYYDPPGGGRLLLEYDTLEQPYKAAPAVRLTGSGDFRQATWTFTDAAFHGRQNDGADFRLSLRDAAPPLALRTVRVTLVTGP